MPDVTPLTNLQYLALNGNSLSGRFPSSAAPASLTVCHVDPILTSSCPSASVMSDSDSLASKCALKCRGGGKPQDAIDDADDGSGTAAGDQDDIVQPVAKPAKSPPKHLQRTPSAAGQEGSTIMGDDSGQTPASLAMASTGEALTRLGSRRKGGLAIAVAVFSMAIIL